MTHISSFFVGMILIVMTHHVTSQDQCGPTVAQIMTQCSQADSIPYDNFLWFASNGTSNNGKAPTDQSGFKTRMCNKEANIGGCIFNHMRQILNTTCQGNNAIPRTVQQYLINVDIKCAHPCRFTLIDDVRQCYVKNHLDADLFLSNRSSGQVIGSAEQDAKSFCSKKGSLIKCIRPILTRCPEAPYLLQSVDFHLPSYEKGIDILCSSVKNYLKGLKCFKDPTAQVKDCLKRTQQTVIQTSIEAQSKNWTEKQMQKALCEININQVDCDVTAWGQKKSDDCTVDVTGLRRHLECQLFPPTCLELQADHFKAVCDPSKFTAASKGTAAGSGDVVTGSAGSFVNSCLATAIFFTIVALFLR